MESPKFKEYLAFYLDILQNDIYYLQKNSLPQFNSIEIDCGTIVEDFLHWNEELLRKGIDDDCSVLYYISFDNELNSAAILTKAAKAKKSLKKIALPKVNKERTSNILYVGKTNSKFPSRFRYHLGLVESKTYALHLRYWAKDYKFTLHLAKICLPKEDIRYLEMMESALHAALQPLLGRSGH